jgi:NAD(P)-dependent dehydrogenase (short-subunit alcohol dehydrogenase family)
VELADKVVVVTGGASGIGAAMSRRFAAEGARAVVVADLDGDGAARVAGEIGGTAVTTNVAEEADVQALVERAIADHGPIDLFCSNAGIGGGGGIEVPDEQWLRTWQINTMAHLYAARAALPGMLARGEGYLLNTVSAAGLLTNLGNAQYTVSKHAALGLAEWLAITYGDAGIKVSVLWGQGVRTPMLLGGADIGDDAARMLLAGAIEPEQVADTVVEGLRAESFLILPHPEVAEYLQRKTGDYDRWLAGMRKLQARVIGGS